MMDGSLSPNLADDKEYFPEEKAGMGTMPSERLPYKQPSRSMQGILHSSLQLTWR